MTSGDPKGAAGVLRALVIYIAVGAGLFAMAAGWVFVGLRLWGN